MQNKLLCVLCQCTVALPKKENLKRHFEAKHKKTVDYLKLVTKNELLSYFEKKSESINNLRTCLSYAVQPNVNATEASYRICLTLAKKKRPFSDAQIVKECYIDSADALFDRFPNKAKIIDEIKKLQLSRDTCSRRCEDMAKDVQQQLHQDLSRCEAWSLAIDESTDQSDTAQLIVSIRYVDSVNQSVNEELLCLLPLMGTTTGQDILVAVASHVEQIELS